MLIDAAGMGTYLPADGRRGGTYLPMGGGGRVPVVFMALIGHRWM